MLGRVVSSENRIVHQFYHITSLSFIRPGGGTPCVTVLDSVDPIERNRPKRQGEDNGSLCTLAEFPVPCFCVYFRIRNRDAVREKTPEEEGTESVAEAEQSSEIQKRHPCEWQVERSLKIICSLCRRSGITTKRFARTTKEWASSPIRTTPSKRIRRMIPSSVAFQNSCEL